MYNDLTFFTNEPERDLYTRFSTILKSNTQFFDVLVRYLSIGDKVADAFKTGIKLKKSLEKSDTKNG